MSSIKRPSIAIRVNGAKSATECDRVRSVAGFFERTPPRFSGFPASGKPLTHGRKKLQTGFFWSPENQKDPQPKDFLNVVVVVIGVDNVE